MRTIVTIQKFDSEGELHSAIKFGSDLFEDAMYFAMDRDWGIGNWMTVMIASAIANDLFSEEGAKLLREFLITEKSRAGIGIDSIKELYFMALAPEEYERGADRDRVLKEKLGYGY